LLKDELEKKEREIAALKEQLALSKEETVRIFDCFCLAVVHSFVSLWLEIITNGDS